MTKGASVRNRIGNLLKNTKGPLDFRIVHNTKIVLVPELTNTKI